MPKPEKNPLTDHLLALGASPADARALAALAGPQPPDLEAGEGILRAHGVDFLLREPHRAAGAALRAVAQLGRQDG